MVTTFNHSMRELCDTLDQKISELERVRDIVKSRLKENVGVPMNTDALEQITKSLALTKEARSAAQSSCCSYNCPIEYEE